MHASNSTCHDVGVEKKRRNRGNFTFRLTWYIRWSCKKAKTFHWWNFNRLDRSSNRHSQYINFRTRCSVGLVTLTAHSSSDYEFRASNGLLQYIIIKVAPCRPWPHCDGICYIIIIYVPLYLPKCLLLIIVKHIFASNNDRSLLRQANLVTW